MHFDSALRRRQAGPISSTAISLSATSTIGTSTSPSTSKSVSSATNPPRSSTFSTNIGNLPSTTSHPSTFPSASALPASSPTHKSDTKPTTIIIAVVVVLAVLSLILAWFLLRRTRRKHKNPKYVPTAFLKKLWEKWDPEPMHYRLPDTNDHLEPHRSTALSSSRPPVSFDSTAGNAAATRNAAGVGRTASQTTTAGVDRNTSVRSVMTLPAYNPSARDNEQVLGREGERGGIDVVIEFPEGADEEEERREAEMEALYQVRLARRRENEEREERRRLRREARERGDYVALREIQARARAGSSASGQRTVEELRAEHERVKKERQRAVSSVSYADLGVARHDGTRLRANSNDSEREGLLGDAASIAASSRYHRRDRSASSVLSIDTQNSDLPSPGLTRSRANSRASRPESPLGRISTQSGERAVSPNTEGRAGSSPEMIEHEDVPPNSPPGYENISLDTPGEERAPPPDYSSPIVGRGEGPANPLFGSPTPVDTPRSSQISAGSGRRTSSTHIGQLIAERRTSSSSSLGTTGTPSTPQPNTDRRNSRGVGGVPQLPSLRLATLPSIHVEGPTPTVPGVAEESLHPHSQS